MDCDKIFAALAKAQGEFPPIARERTVKIETSNGGTYSYDYAPLDVILAAVRPALTANGLCIVQPIRGATLHTILAHESGQFIEGDMELPRSGDIKTWGGEITYRRRYALLAMLGIAAEDDDDASEVKGEQKRKAAPPPRQPVKSAAKAQPEPRPEPTPHEKMVTVGEQPATNGDRKRKKLAVVHGGAMVEWKSRAVAFVERFPYYAAPNGEPQWNHLLAFAATRDIELVNLGNIAELFEMLEKHAAENHPAQ